MTPDALSLEQVARLVYGMLKIRRARDGCLVADVKLRGVKANARAPMHVADMIRLVDASVNMVDTIR